MALPPFLEPPGDTKVRNEKKKDISLIYFICYGYNYYLYEGNLAMRYITGFNTYFCM